MNHKLSTIALTTLLVLLVIGSIGTAIDTQDIDETCSTNDRFLFRNNGIWNCSIIHEEIDLPHIFSHTNETIPVRTENNWTNITFLQENAEIKLNITHSHNMSDSHIFYIDEEGIYNIDYDIDMQDTSASATNIDAAARVIHAINGSEIEGSVFETDITKQGVQVELSHNFLAHLDANDAITFQFIASDPDVEISTHGTYGDFPESVTIIIHKISNQ